MYDKVIICDCKYELTTVVVSKEHTRKVVHVRRKHQYEYMMEFLQYIMDNPSPYVANVLHFAGVVNNPPIYAGYDFYYEYTMESLLPLSQAERDAVYVYASIDDMSEDATESYVRKFTKEEEDVIHDNLPKAFPALYETLRTVGPVYHDLHEENVMKTSSGQFKVIDLETFVHYNAKRKAVMPNFRKE